MTELFRTLDGSISPSYHHLRQGAELKSVNNSVLCTAVQKTHRQLLHRAKAAHLFNGPGLEGQKSVPIRAHIKHDNFKGGRRGCSVRLGLSNFNLAA
jgi:hypothetical protein